MSDDVASYVDDLLSGRLGEPERRFVLLGGVLEPVEATPYIHKRRRRGQPKARWSGVHRIYRWYDLAGVLLYVGITNNLASRSSNHISTSFWMRYATRMESQPEGYLSREECEAAERLAIREERPIFNVAHQSDGYRDRQIDYVVEHDGRAEDVADYLRWVEDF